MTTIAQDMRFRLSLIHYAEKYGVTQAARKYKTYRQYTYRWIKPLLMSSPGFDMVRLFGKCRRIIPQLSNEAAGLEIFKRNFEKLSAYCVTYA